MTNPFDAWIADVLGVIIPPAAPAGGRPGAPPAPPPPAAPSDPLQAKVDAAVAMLEKRRTQLAADGLPTASIDADIKKLQASVAKAKTARDKAGAEAKAATAEKDAGAEVSRQDHAQTEGADKAIGRLADAAGAQIKALPDGPDKSKLAAQYDALTKQITAAKTITDPAALAKQRQALDQSAQALMKAATAAAGTKEAAAAQQAAFQDALKEKYGISIGTKGLKNKADTNFEKLYETLESVPLSDVTHVNMRDITYRDNLQEGGPIGYYDGKVSAQFGDFGDGQQAERPGRYHDITATTKDEKTEPPPNAFKITVLHELGHSVDTRWGLVETYAYGKGGGQWQVQSAAGLAKQAVAKMGDVPGVKPADLQAAVAAALAGKEKWPEGVDADVVAKLKTALASWFELSTSSYTSPVTRDKRNFFQKGDHFYSYSKDEHDALKVSDYQWSAPAEWFAELYAICWYKHRPPPAGIASGLLDYLPKAGGGAAGPGAPG